MSCLCRDRSESSTSCLVSDDKFKSTESLPAVKTSRLSVQPSSDDELSSSQPNVCLSDGGSPAQTDVADNDPRSSSRVQTPSSGTFTADEEELRGTTVSETVEERKPDSADDDSGSVGGSFDELGPRAGRPRPADHRWRSLDRRATAGADWNARRRSTDRPLRSPELSKRAAARVRSVDSRASPDSRASTAVPDPSSAQSDAEVARRRAETDADYRKTTEDLTLDIDTALAEVMSEIESLGFGHVVFGDGEDSVKAENEFVAPSSPSSSSSRRKTQTSSFSVPRQDFEDAPDLVIGLPTCTTGPQSSPKNLATDEQQICRSEAERQQLASTSSDGSGSSSDSAAGDSVGQTTTSPTHSLTSAEVFANANQCTIKKMATAAPAGPGPSAGRVSQPGDRTSLRSATSSVETVPPGSGRPVPAYRARSVDASAVLTTSFGGLPRSTSPPARGPPHPLPKSKPASARRSEKPYQALADIRPDVEFVRAIIPPFGDADVAAAAAATTYTLPRDLGGPSRGGRPDAAYGGRADVGRSMSVGDATAAMDPAAQLRAPTARPGNARDPSPTGGKPPVKVKPPVMKKPARAGEVIKRLQESLAQQGAGMSVSAPQ